MCTRTQTSSTSGTSGNAYCQTFHIAFLRNRLHKYTHVENHLLMARDIRMVKPLSAIIGRYARTLEQITFARNTHSQWTGERINFLRKSNVRSCRTIDMAKFIQKNYEWSLRSYGKQRGSRALVIRAKTNRTTEKRSRNSNRLLAPWDILLNIHFPQQMRTVLYTIQWQLNRK